MSGYLRRLRCVRCGRQYPDPSLALIGAGCPACAGAGVPANVLPVYDLTAGELPVDPSQPGLFRYRALLPLAAGTAAVSLGEGGTPVVGLPRLADRAGVAEVWVKDESRNPTWSTRTGSPRWR
jgi:threonine synthase